MGDTWCSYRAFAAEAFEARCLTLGPTFSEAEWAALSAKRPADPAVRAAYQPAMLFDEPECDDEGEPLETTRVPALVTTPEQAQTLVDACFTDCGAAFLATYNLVQALGEDSVARALAGAANQVARDAWGQLGRAVGYPNTNAGMPWWFERAYPRDHWIGVVGPAELTRLVSAVRASRVVDAAAELLQPRAPASASVLLQVVEFYTRIADAGAHWVLAVESGS